MRVSEAQAKHLKQIGKKVIARKMKEKHSMIQNDEIDG